MYVCVCMSRYMCTYEHTYIHICIYTWTCTYYPKHLLKCSMNVFFFLSPVVICAQSLVKKNLVQVHSPACCGRCGCWPRNRRRLRRRGWRASRPREASPCRTRTAGWRTRARRCPRRSAPARASGCRWQWPGRSCTLPGSQPEWTMTKERASRFLVNKKSTNKREDEVKQKACDGKRCVCGILLIFPFTGQLNSKEMTNYIKFIYC